VRVERMDHQIEQLLHFRLKLVSFHWDSLSSPLPRPMPAGSRA
jgi:hypothetical protein